ncbi:hypothetical protein ABZ587_31115, partial [Streptomyces sp. NPDC018352]
EQGDHTLVHPPTLKPSRAMREGSTRRGATRLCVSGGGDDRARQENAQLKRADDVLRTASAFLRRARRDAELTEQIKEIHTDSGGVYGSSHPVSHISRRRERTGARERL